jgi:hypothetical protein
MEIDEVGCVAGKWGCTRYDEKSEGWTPWCRSESPFLSPLCATQAVNVEAGARSQISSVVAACLVALAVNFLTTTFFYIPMCSLAAIVQVPTLSSQHDEASMWEDSPLHPKRDDRITHTLQKDKWRDGFLPSLLYPVMTCGFSHVSRVRVAFSGGDLRCD